MRLNPYYHFPVTLSFNEVNDILIPLKDHSGRETDFFQTTFATGGSVKLWERFVAKLDKYKAQAAEAAARGGGVRQIIGDPTVMVPAAAAAGGDGDEERVSA